MEQLILGLVLLIDLPERPGQDDGGVLDEEENRLLGLQFEFLPNNALELEQGYVIGHKVGFHIDLWETLFRWRPLQHHLGEI